MDSRLNEIINSYFDNNGDQPDFAEKSKAALIEELHIYHAELQSQFEELRDSQEKLDHALELYHTFFESNPLPCVLINSEGEVLRLNQSVKNLTILETPQGSGGKYLRHVFVPEDSLRFVSLLADVKKRGEAKGVLRIQRDRLLTFEVRLTQLYLNSYGEHMIIVYLYDISERVEAELMLSIQKKRVQNILGGTNVGTWEWNVQTGECIFNERWAEIIGHHLEDLAPVSIYTWIEFAHPEDLAASNEQLQVHFEGKTEFYDIECRMKHKDGYWIWVHDRGKVFSWTEDGKPEWMYGSHEDITDRKQLQLELSEQSQQLSLAYNDALQANAAKTRFLSHMTHEIRTPLTAITGYIELLNLEHAMNDDAKEILGTIGRNAKHLMNVVNDILDFAKIEHDELQVEEVSFNLPALIKDIIETMQIFAETKKVSLGYEYAHEVPVEVRSDPVRVRQVIINLLNNAIKFTNDGGVRLIVRFAHSLNDELIAVEVVDTGIGIPLEKQATIFEAFKQADESTTRQYGGTGLGLSISKQIALNLGGNVMLASEPGVGTSFVFTFTSSSQVATGSRLNTYAFDHESNAEPITLEGMNVLLCEDNPDNQRLFKYLLEKQNLNVHTASNGQEALDQYAAHGDSIQFILMDIQMPVMDGFEALTHLREQGCNQPIIALTAHAYEEEKQRCLEHGFNAFATKPIKIEDLLAILQQAMSR